MIINITQIIHHSGEKVPFQCRNLVDTFLTNQYRTDYHCVLLPKDSLLYTSFLDAYWSIINNHKESGKTKLRTFCKTTCLDSENKSVLGPPWLLSMPTCHVRMLVWILAVLVLIQLPAKAPRKAMKIDQVLGPLTIMWKTTMEFLAPASAQASPNYRDFLGSKSPGQQMDFSLFFPSSLLPSMSLCFSCIEWTEDRLLAKQIYLTCACHVKARKQSGQINCHEILVHFWKILLSIKHVIRVIMELCINY